MLHFVRTFKVFCNQYQTIKLYNGSYTICYNNVIPFIIQLDIYRNRGAVALDGRIEPGDMILQVNDINFENMSNDEAVRVLREVVQKPG